MTFHFILLAAGFGSRFGSNKLLASLDGKPLYRHGLDTLIGLRTRASFPITITVVTQYDEIADALKDGPVSVAINEDASRGQTSSIRTGVSALIGRGEIRDGDYLVFLAGDQPFISAASLEVYLDQIALHKPLLASYAVGERFRNPGAFSAELIPELMALSGDGGGREVLKAHRGDVMLFTDFDPQEIRDIDRPEDLSVYSGL